MVLGFKRGREASAGVGRHSGWHERRRADLVSLREGQGKAAWVMKRAAGELSVWFWDSNVGGKPVLVLDGIVDGMNVDGLTLSPSGKLLYFHVFSKLNGNPFHLITGVVPDKIYVWDGSKATLIGEGLAIGAVSEGGVVAATGNQVVEISPTGTTSTLFTVETSASDLSWSPDGTTLAFAYQRFNHAFLAFYVRGSMYLEFAPATIYTESTPAWSPDGTKVATLRKHDAYDLNGYTTATKYSVQVYDTITQSSKEIFRDWGIGYPMSFETATFPLTWIDNDVVIVPNESTGWVRVLGISVSNSTSFYLTPDGCESTDYVVEKGYIYVSHNCDDLNARGFSVVDPWNRKMTSIVKGTIGKVSGLGVPNGVAPLAGGAVLYLEATVDSPAHLQIIQPPYTQSTCFFSCDNTYSVPLVVPTMYKFRSLDDEFDIYFHAFVPPSSFKPPYPVIFQTHGGPADQTYPSFHPFIPFSRIYAELQYYANNGYYTISINYRGGTGQGKKFRDCEHCGDQGAVEYKDILGTFQFLQNLSFVDMSRVGITGLSYGGLNTLQALSRNSDLFKVGVSNAGVYNIIAAERYNGENVQYSYMPRMSDGIEGPDSSLLDPEWTTRVNQNIQRTYDSSPISYLKGLTSPLLLIHGDLDPTVSIKQTIALATTLEALGRPVETLILPGEVHSFALLSAYVQAAEAGFNFLDKYLE
eukprot:TRINITY_DN1246_c0_g1_i1.p1 TRINITY_DN1246_c0_g1~~TRINITY_DN1246_c0_g1_i1.p1  ORF type:complete len:698 (-),score=129.02 TRINITY_DN1246_c0_g1_i1:11-2104(-)